MMKYAIVQSGSSQLRAEEGKVLEVDLLAKEPGEGVEFDVLLLADGDNVQVGAPTVATVNPANKSWRNLSAV